MAFSLAFVTVDHNQGKSILINDASTDWASIADLGDITGVVFTITSLYTGTVMSPATASISVPVGTTAFADGFSYEITNVQLGMSAASPIENSIYRIKMDVYDTPVIEHTFTSDEVFAYNCYTIRDEFIAEKATYIDSVYSKDMDYGNWLDFLIVTIESNTLYGNSSAIYYCFDIFDRLAT
jgi:hypothetical protein